MQLGNLLLWMAMVCTAFSAAAYLAAGFGRREWISIARSAFYAMVIATVGVSAYLLILILRGRFDISYVYAYTSRDLELIYKISAFWAGQEGSFLLWALFGAILGMMLAHKSGRYEPWIMGFWSIVQAFFFTLLLIRSPFTLTLDQRPDASLMDGQGLNPLLKNPWMAIHPPLVFLGYAAMAVPAAFVVAALIRREYDSWARDSLPWALFAWVTLGAGIFVGGYWAYEVLGWGGYWGWDPVENASLVPWLTGTALLHGLLVERSRGTLRRTNMVMALLSFLLIIYATFLTRSGILGDFSVHSFADLGVNGYLIGFMVFFTLVSFVLYVWRAKEIPGGPAFSGVKSREFAFFLTIIVLAVSAGLILFGTSSPIYTRWMGKPQSFAPEFYVRTNTPVAIALLALMALAPMLPWGTREHNARKDVGLKLTLAGVAAAIMIGVVVLMVMYARGRAEVALPAGAKTAVGLLAVVALIINGWLMLIRGRVTIRSIAGVTAHTGIALMFLGILFSAASRPEKLVLSIGRPGKESHGYTFRYMGHEPISDSGSSGQEGAERKSAMKIRVTGRGVDYIARPMLQATRDGMMRSPAIRKTISGDLYIAPVEDIGVKNLTIAENMQPPVTVGGIEYRFLGFDMSGAHTLDSLNVGARIELRRNGKSVTAIPRMLVSQEGRRFIDAVVPEEDVVVRLDAMSVEQRMVQISVTPRTERIVIEVSEKPWISFLWLGAILALTGGGIGIWRRTCENARTCAVEDEAPRLEEAASLT